MFSSGFKPIARADARILILGTLPGAMSLEYQQYYAQPYNAFWKIMGELIGASPNLSYAQRKRALVEGGIAVWDVCAAAYRAGSLDTAIQLATIVPNDFKTFFQTHQQIRLIGFNGSKAADIFHRKILPTLPDHFQSIRRETLPSTSPANARMPFERKLAIWQEVLGLSTQHGR